MKIRIFTLAKELDMDSKLLIEYCQKLGIILKNSALASITPEEKEQVLALIKQATQPESAAKPEPIVPLREPTRPVTGKVPKIKSLAPRPQSPRDLREPQIPELPAEPARFGDLAASATAVAEAGEELESDAGVAGSTTMVAELGEEPAVAEAEAPGLERAAEIESEVAEVQGTAVETKGVTERPASPPPASAKPAMAPRGTVPQAPPPVEVGSRGPGTGPSPATTTTTPAPTTVSAEIPPSAVPVAEVESTTSTTAPTTGKPAPGAPSRPVATPIRREDYMPASGSVRSIGTKATSSAVKGAAPAAKPAAVSTEPAGGTKEGGAGEAVKEGPKKKARPSPMLPQIAVMPPMKLPTAAAPVEAPAQKPDLRLPKDIIQERRPLQEHIRQHTEEKKKKKLGEMLEEFMDETMKKGIKGAKAAPAPAAAGGGGLISERKQRQERRHRVHVQTDEELESTSMRNRALRMRHKKHSHVAPAKTSAVIEFPISVRSLSEAIGRRAADLVKALMQRGILANINSSLDEETALELALGMGIDLKVKREKDFEQEFDEAVQSASDSDQLISRSPIVTILGHVDHGKTTLLDKIRSTNVAAGEKGGITQHIAAYQVNHHGQKITFLDTPGHAAFAEMRARGANVTDIAILVVAANDGVMPQTIEAISHAKAAGVPIIVALNKCDLPDRNEQRVLQELAAHNVLVAEWGGDTEVVRTSGLTGHGIDELLETILTLAELKEYKADPVRPAHGVCLEAFRDEGRGVLAWFIVQQGTLKLGDVVLCGPAYGRIRTIYDDHDQELSEAGPSVPVKVAGLDIIPNAGDKFLCVQDIEQAREVAETRRTRGRETQLAQKGKLRTLEEILNDARGGGVQELPIIIKADTPGSVEALRAELGKFSHPEVRVNLMHVGVGGVNESDVYLAAAAGAIVVAFHVIPEDRAQSLAEREGVEIRQYGIIYEVTDDIKKALEGLLRPEKVEVNTGRAVVLQTFNISRFGTIAGCRVLNGLIERSNRIRLIRDQRVLHDYNIGSLKRGKDDVKEVREGLECGIRLEGFDDVKEGDLFQAYRVDEVKRTLE